MPFRDIAFAAELDRHVDPECEDQARILCGEDPASRKCVIEDLRNMIYERGECRPPRMDDAFLIRFLRARRFIPARAHRLVRSGTGTYDSMVRYCKFREQNPHLWREVYWCGLERLGNVIEGVLFDRPDVGRLIICRLGEWDPDISPVDDILRGCILLLEIGIMQPKLQVLGGTSIFDCAGIGMKHIRQLTPSSAMQTMDVMGLAFPFHQRAVHIINCSRIFKNLIYVFKKLVPAEIWDRVHFHGYDLSSLHRYIDPACLPTRYGGTHEAVSMKEWLNKIKQYKNKEFDEDLRTLGYAVDE